MTSFMKFFSVVYHPLLMMSYLLAVFYIYQPEFFSPVDQSQLPKLIIAGFITTFLIPVLSVLIMKFTSRIASLELSNRDERFMPFLTILLFYGSTTYLFTTRIGVIPPLSSIFYSATFLIGLLLAITFRFKISIHSAASWALSGILVAVALKYSGSSLVVPVMGSFILAGIVASSRIYLKKHNSHEVWSGCTVGFIVGFLPVWFW